MTDYTSASIRLRRDRLIEQLHYRYGITVYPHPRRPHAVVVSESDLARLEHAIFRDDLLNPVGRGYYSWLGGELSVITAPDWACDPLSVALARLYAVTVASWARPAIRALTRLLRRPTGEGRSDR